MRLQHFTTHNQARSSGGHLPRWVPVKGLVHDKTTSCITQEECTMALQSVLVDAIICSWADYFIGNVFHGCRVCNPICPINCSQNPSDEHVSDKPGVYVRSSTRDYVCVCVSICFLYICKLSRSNLLCITYTIYPSSCSRLETATIYRIYHNCPQEPQHYPYWRLCGSCLRVNQLIPADTSRRCSTMSQYIQQLRLRWGKPFVAVACVDWDNWLGLSQNSRGYPGTLWPF